MIFCKAPAFVVSQDQHFNGGMTKTTDGQSIGRISKSSLSRWSELNDQTIRIMKLIAFILLAAGLQVSANGYTQKITLSLKNAPLEKVFESIKQQSGYRFFYNEEQSQKSKPVTIQVKDASLDETLLICFKDQPFTYTIINQMIVVKEKTKDFTIQTQVQSGPPLIDVKGRVLNEKGEPVEGVTITVKGTTKTAVTDANGEFLLATIEKDAVLVFTHVSMESFELKVSGETELAINLKTKVSALGDVTVTVNTGYQQIPKERATGSFTQIDNKLYNEQVGTNVIERLKYISNGIVPFSNRVGTVAKDQILIRGLSTLTLSIQKPLIIVDNFEYQGDINNINPNDVESVTFLKDAAAGSIWGAKAANGVVVITTKKGRYNQKTKIEINSNVTVIDQPDLFYLKNISSSDLINVEQFLFSKNFRFSDTAGSAHRPFSPVYEILFKRRNGLISAADSASQIDALRGLDVRNDFNKYFYQKAINQQYSLSLRGGSNNIAWGLSGGFDKNINEIKSGYDRVNVRFDNTYKVARNLEVNTILYYTQSKTSSGRPAYGSINTITGVIPAYSQFADANGKALPLYTRYRQGYIDTLGAGKLLDWRYYPLDDYKHTQNKINLQDINAVVGINYKILNSLSIDVKYRYEKQRSDNQTLYDQQSYLTRDLINGFSQLNRTTGVVTYKIPKGDILDLTNSTIIAQNIRGQINFNSTWNRHSIIALSGAEISETISKSNLYRTYGYNGNILTYANVDYTQPYPTFIGGSDFIPNPANFGKTNTRFVSFYSNGAYTYENKYTFSASIRRDASNLFGVDINDKWKPLWSTGLSWEISKENFYKIEILPSLRLRLTYGHQGNIDTRKVGVTTFGYTGTNPFTLTPFGQVENFVNPGLKWEQVAMFNAGLDFATKNHRISGSLEFYQKNITDLYGPSIIDLTTGLGTPTITKNVGEMKGHGVDIELNTINIDRVVRWTSNFILNNYRDKVTQYNKPSNFKPGQLISTQFIDGYPSFSLFVYKWAGLDPTSGDPQGYINKQVSKDWASIIRGEGTLEDIKYVGSRLPTVFGSVGNTITWKNVSFSARITYKFGYYFLRESINYTSLVNNLSGHSDFALRWQKSGDESHTNIPAFSYPLNSDRDIFYSNSEVLVTKGDHIRFQYLNISYAVNKTNFKNLPFENIQLYAAINNLGIIWRANNYNIDPDYGSLPPAKSIALGLKVDF